MSNRIKPSYRSETCAGFSLVELSLVLIIVGAMAGTLLSPMAFNLEQSKRKQAREQLEQLHHSLVGHLVLTGRLPCPVGELDNPNPQSEAHSPSAPCALSVGQLPAIDLGVQGPQTPQGQLLDPWGNPYVYAVSLTDHDEHGQQGWPDWTTAGDIHSIGYQQLQADLTLCRSAAQGNCSRLDTVANQIAWVILSQGSNHTGNDIQAENTDTDKVFAYTEYSQAQGSEFDDLLIWGSRNEMVFWLLQSSL